MRARVTPHLSADRRPDLTLVSAGYERTGSEPLERRRFDGPPPLARPSDRLEPWLLETGSPLVAFADAAFQRGLPFQTAVTVMLERQLIAEVLASRGLARLLPDLDRTARAATVECELSDGLAAYLRALSSRSRDLERTPPHIVAIPMRLGERLGEGDAIVARLEPRLLESALAWERAAALRGLTMTEWAALAALGAAR
jgi:hypothetical protein